MLYHFIGNGGRDHYNLKDLNKTKGKPDVHEREEIAFDSAIEYGQSKLDRATKPKDVKRWTLNVKDITKLKEDRKHHWEHEH